MVEGDRNMQLTYNNRKYTFYICVSVHHNSILYKEVNRPQTSLLDIHHPDPWHAPVGASTVVNTPGDGRRKSPKFCSD